MMFPKRFREVRIGFEIRQTQKCFIIFELKFEPIIESSLRVRIPSLSFQKGKRVSKKPVVLTGDDKASSPTHIEGKPIKKILEKELKLGSEKVSEWGRCSPRLSHSD